MYCAGKQMDKTHCLVCLYDTYRHYVGSSFNRNLDSHRIIKNFFKISLFVLL